MQEIIDTEFKHATVISILHRLEHVRRYDKVALIDHGQLLEFGRPEDLIARTNSKFAELYRLA